METTTESLESSDMHTAKPSTSSDSYMSAEGRADLVNPITVSSEASVSQEDDFSQLKTKNTERSKRARRLSDSSDDDGTSPNRPREPSDSQYSSDDCQKNDDAKKDNFDVDTAKPKPRTSSDSLYSSGEDRADLVIIISSETQGSSREDESSQLKTKNTERSRRARRYVSSGSSGDESTSQNQKSPRKPIDSPCSSKNCQKNGNSKRSMSNESRASEENDSSKPQKKNKKIKKAKQPPNKASDKNCRRKNKTPTKRKSSGDSLPEDDSEYFPPQTRNSKRRKKGRQPSPAPKDKATTSRNKKKSSKKSDAISEPENSNDDFQEYTLGEMMFSDVINKYSKKEASSGSSSSDESDDSQDHTRSSEECSDDSASQSRTASPSESEETSDESQVQTKNEKKGRKARKLSFSSPEEASTSKNKNSNRKTSNSSEDETDDSQTQSSHVESNSPKGDSISEGESDSKNSSISKDESDSSQVKEPVISPKKYKNLRIASDTSDDEKEKKLPIESPRKINDVHLLKHKHRQLEPAVTFGSTKDVHEIIYDGKTNDDLALPEFSKLLWRVVKSNKIDPEKASLLVRAGVNVNLNEYGEYSDSPENSVLHVVAEKAWREKYEPLALTLMSYGANINKINGEGNSVLWSAVKGGSVIVVAELMRRGVQMGNEYNKVLRLAAESHSNSAKILPLLVAYNDADMETRDRRAMHALRCLVNGDGDLTAMKVLLDYILPLNDIDDDGSTLLHRAVIDSKFEMVKLLLEYDANPRMKRRDGNPPLWFAARQPTSAIAGLLIKHGASVQDCNDLGQYPIHAACNSQSLENIRLLLHHGAEINVPDTYHVWTPFAMVNHQHLSDVTKLIIQHLALLNHKNIKLYQSDMKRIRELVDFRKYYAQCSKELHKLKTLIIYEDISAYCLFNYDAKKMSHLIHNSELIDEYSKKKEQIQKASPVYWPAIHKRMKIAWSRRDKLISIENAIREASNNVLTVDVCEKIAYLACYDSLIDDEMKEMSSA